MLGGIMNENTEKMIKTKVNLEYQPPAIIQKKEIQAELQTNVLPDEPASPNRG